LGPVYNTESEVGEAIRQAGIPVSDIYITAKGEMRPVIRKRLDH
jgi:diketogulonate reductase-like aldo/keto reductase